MPEFGSFCLLLGLGLTIYTFVVGGFALWGGSVGGLRATGIPRRAGTGWARRRGGLELPASWRCAAAAFALVWAALSNDFSVEYIRAHSNIALNPAYKFAALWSGQEGSLLLWAWLLSAYGFVVRVRHRVDVRLSAFASVILAAIQVFFLLLLVVATPPSPLHRGRWRPMARG